MDEFKNIPCFEKYQCDKNGNIFSKKNKILLKHLVNENGYHCVNLYDRAGKLHYMKVSRIVLLTFVGKPKEKEHAAHLDGNKSNNTLKNLKWVSPQENMDHKQIHGTYYKGLNHPLCRLSKNEVIEIRKLFKRTSERKSNMKELAKKFGVSDRTISKYLKEEK